MTCSGLMPRRSAVSASVIQANCRIEPRAASRIRSLDLFCVALDAMALPTEERDLRDRIHHDASGTPGQMSRVSPDRIEPSRWLATLISLTSIGLLASARTRADGTRPQRCTHARELTTVSEATARRRATQCRAVAGYGRDQARATVGDAGDVGCPWGSPRRRSRIPVRSARSRRQERKPGVDRLRQDG